ncbi:DUF4407 domain-containing protein [Actinoplanes sp. NPDC089786]|uniref:DUF4407 domain-containing protein n=1 Tax=Actinoplanes sp. NPDC089786 TaxID=3155185 RepID=UPI00343C7CD9
MPRRRDVLLRVANVNPDSVNTHSDRVLYNAIGVFVLLYFVYATVGGAAFVDASANYTHPWWQWLVGPLVAVGVVAYDRAVVGRVSISYQNLDSADPRHLLKRPTIGLYLGRVGLALLFAVIITEPLMLARYRGEIDAHLNRVHNEQILAMSSSGALGAYDQRLASLRQRAAEDDAAVAKLTVQAVAKRRDARALYRQALADSEGDGISRKAGCPAGGDCDTLVRRSRALDDQAAALDKQAASLRVSQQPGRDARTEELVSLTRLIADQRERNAAAIRADAGFGARTKAMAHLVTSDFWGIGVFYLGIALLLVALDCAAVGLKFVSRGNAYERAEARLAREREHAALIAYERGVADARVYGEATMRVVAGGVDAATRDEQLNEMATERARSVLRDNVAAYKPRYRHMSTQPERPVERLANQNPVRT